MGRKTYEQVIGLGQWPYAGKPTYVFSKDPSAGDHPHIEFVSRSPRSFLSEFFTLSDENLCLVGGIGLVASFRADRLIDEYIISLMRVLLGEGKPLFDGAHPEASLNLLEARSYESGVVQLHYATR